MLAAILIWEAYRGSESFRCTFEAFSASASDFRGQNMLHMVIIWFMDSSMFESSFAAGASRGTLLHDSNGSVKNIVAADLPSQTTETSGRDMPLSKTVFSSDTHSSQARIELSNSHNSKW